MGQALGARSELERSTAVSLVFLLTLEVFAQFELGKTLNFSGSVVDDASRRHKLMDQYLRIMNAKLHASHFLLRIKEARIRLDRLRVGDV